MSYRFSAMLHVPLIVDDPDAVFEQAVAAGAEVRAAMKDQDYGWRDGSVVDLQSLQIQ